MNLITRLIKEDDGQGMVEYTLVVLMVALVFWVGVKGDQRWRSFGEGLGKGSRLRYVAVFVQRVTDNLPASR